MGCSSSQMGEVESFERYVDVRVYIRTKEGIRKN
jgi:beta-galactosidase beta subunit